MNSTTNSTLSPTMAPSCPTPAPMPAVSSWVRSIALCIVVLLAPDIYKSVKSIKDVSKRRTIGTIIMLVPTLLLIMNIQAEFWNPSWCKGKIQITASCLYLAKGLIAYLYCARTEIAVKARLGAGSNKLVLNGTKFLVFISLTFNLGKALFIFNNYWKDVNGKMVCIRDFGPSTWAMTDEIMFGSLDAVTLFMLIHFYRQQYGRSDSKTSQAGGANAAIHSVLRRIIWLSSVSLCVTAVCLGIQISNPKTAANTGTFDASVAMVTLCVVFIKPSKENGGSAHSNTRVSSIAPSSVAH